MLAAGAAFFACSLITYPTAAAALRGTSGTSPLQHDALSTAAVANGLAETLNKLPLAAFVPDLPDTEVMWLGLSAGFVTALASCACHNSLFTPCKQMVYKIMPASEAKESKAVVDVVGGQVRGSGAGGVGVWGLSESAILSACGC